nr:NBS-containing resistance-like protein [Tanacetum cinerariifolium]
MLNCNPCMTSVDTEKKIGREGSPFTDPTLNHSLAGALQYLTFTRPNLSYAVQQLCLYMHDPREPHLNTMKRVLLCPATRRSTSEYCVFLGDNLLTWSSKRQDTLFCSSAEAEYRGVVNAVAETSWIRNLLRELHTPTFTATLVYYDNVGVVYMFANPVQHQRTKHIEIDIHFIRDKVAAGHVRVLHVSSRFHAYALGNYNDDEGTRKVTGMVGEISRRGSGETSGSLIGTTHRLPVLLNSRDCSLVVGQPQDEANTSVSYISGIKKARALSDRKHSRGCEDLLQQIDAIRKTLSQSTEALE